VKFLDGAWFPVVLAIVVFTVLRTWRRGRSCCTTRSVKDGIQHRHFLPGLMLAPPTRVPGTAIFLTGQTGMVPHALLHNLKHNKVLHERNVFLTVETLNVPPRRSEKRLKIEPIGDDFYRVTVRFGFMETPDVPLALMRSCDRGGIPFDPMDTTYFASRETSWPPPPRHADLARPPVRLHAPQRGAGDGVLPHSGQPVGGTGRAGRDLIDTRHWSRATFRANADNRCLICNNGYSGPRCTTGASQTVIRATAGWTWIR
jgi:hypothetical protein